MATGPHAPATRAPGEAGTAQRRPAAIAHRLARAPPDHHATGPQGQARDRPPGGLGMPRLRNTGSRPTPARPPRPQAAPPRRRQDCRSGPPAPAAARAPPPDSHSRGATRADAADPRGRQWGPGAPHRLPSPATQPLPANSPVALPCPAPPTPAKYKRTMPGRPGAARAPRSAAGSPPPDRPAPGAASVGAPPPATHPPARAQRGPRPPPRRRHARTGCARAA